MSKRAAGVIVAAACAAVLSLAAAGPVSCQCCEPYIAAETRWRPSAGVYYLGPYWILADRRGNVYAGVVRNGVMGMYASGDRGETWDDGNFDIGEGSAFLGAAVTAEGVLVAAYIKDLALWARTSFDRGASWTVPVRVADTGDPFLSVRFELEVRPTGLTAVRVRYDIRSLQERIRVAASPDFGLTWGAPLVLDDVDRGKEPAQLLALDDTVAVVAWQEGTRILTRRTVDAGASWEPPVLANAVPTADLAPSSPSLATTGAGNFQLAYFTVSPYQVRVALSTDRAATWSGGEVVLGDAWAVYEPLRTVSPREGELVVGGWQASTTPAIYADMSADHRRSWLGGPTFFAENGTGLHHVRLASGPGGSPVAVHDDYRISDSGTCPPDAGGTCESIFFQRSCNGMGEWVGPELRLDTDGPGEGPHSEDAELVADGNGRVHVLWMDGEHPDGFIVHHVAVGLYPARVAVRLVREEPDPCLPSAWWIEVIEAPPPGCPSPAYQWLRDGSPLPGETGTDLFVPDGDPPAAYRVAVACGGTGQCETGSDEVRIEPFQPPGPLELQVNDVPADECLPAHHILEVVEGSLGECPVPSYQWYRDGAALPGETGTTLEVSARTTPPGTYDFHYEIACGSPRSCQTVSPSVRLNVEPWTAPPAADLGNVLRGERHGPWAPSIEAAFEWTLDPALPRPPGSHYHLYRSLDPRSLDFLADYEPHAELRFEESTPMGPQDRNHIHFYKVFAAGPCERESGD